MDFTFTRIIRILHISHLAKVGPTTHEFCSYMNFTFSPQNKSFDVKVPSVFNTLQRMGMNLRFDRLLNLSHMPAAKENPTTQMNFTSTPHSLAYLIHARSFCACNLWFTGCLEYAGYA